MLEYHVDKLFVDNQFKLCIMKPVYYFVVKIKTYSYIFIVLYRINKDMTISLLQFVNDF